MAALPENPREFFQAYGDTEKLLGTALHKRNEANIRLLHGYVRDRRAALCLGAGASADIGLPLWSKLLNTLMRALLLEAYPLGVNAGTASATTLHADQLHTVLGALSVFGEIDMLEAAEYIQMHMHARAVYESRRQWVDIDPAVRARENMARLVYAALQWHREKKKVPDWSVLDALADLTADGGITKVINYNYDDSFEYALGERRERRGKDRRQYKPWRNEECLCHPPTDDDTTNVYHVHGRLSMFCCQENTSGTLLGHELEEDLHDGIILSESSYRQIAANAYHPINIRQAELLQTHACLFVGFSAQDSNYRRIIAGIPVRPDTLDQRLLDIVYPASTAGPLPDDASPNRCPHFMFFSINSLVNNLYKAIRADSVAPPSPEAAVEMLRELLKIQATYYYAYNVRPIFVQYNERNADDVEVFSPGDFVRVLGRAWEP